MKDIDNFNRLEERAWRIETKKIKITAAKKPHFSLFSLHSLPCLLCKKGILKLYCKICPPITGIYDLQYQHEDAEKI